MTVRACAPGKLLISGAYAVLDGAPAIVCAVSRYAYAFDDEDDASNETAPAEVRAALDRPCAIDVHELEHDGLKLGLGSSAAALVAALALRAGQRGEDLAAASVRDAIFARAREVHSRVQRGGSGVDVAASTFGGTLRYTTEGFGPVDLPGKTRLAAFFSGRSARTSTLRERVEALSKRDPSAYATAMAALRETAYAASRAVDQKDVAMLVSAVSTSLAGLAALGAAADAPIVPPEFAKLGDAARSEHAAFIPSGAGGGDIGVFVGTAAPSTSFTQQAERVGMKLVPLEIDSRGVRLEENRTHST